MVIKIDDYSDVPIYMQIRNQIVMGISSGELSPGEQLPTVRALALEMGINTMTVSKTYQILKNEGYGAFLSPCDRFFSNNSVCRKLGWMSQQSEVIIMIIIVNREKHT